jgi:hypothetical protein
VSSLPEHPSKSLQQLEPTHRQPERQRSWCLPLAVVVDLEQPVLVFQAAPPLVLPVEAVGEQRLGFTL